MKSDHPQPSSSLEQVVAARERLSRRAMATAAALLTVIALLLLIWVPAVLALEPPRPGELATARAPRQAGRGAAARQGARQLQTRPGPAQVRREQGSAQPTWPPAPSLTPPGSWAGMPTTGERQDPDAAHRLLRLPALQRRGDHQCQAVRRRGRTPATSPTRACTTTTRAPRTTSSTSAATCSAGTGRPTRAPAWAASATPRARPSSRKRSTTTTPRDTTSRSTTTTATATIDYFVVAWAGPDQGWGSNWWGYQTSWDNTTSPVLDGKTLAKYSWQWECRYQTDGHDRRRLRPGRGDARDGPRPRAARLLRLRRHDVGPDGGVGQLDMMDANWGDHNSFSKWVLDWITPQVVTGAPRSVTLASSGTTNKALVVMPGAQREQSLRGVLRRREPRAGWATTAIAPRTPNYNMPNDGLLVWHVDARLHSTQYGDDYLYGQLLHGAQAAAPHGGRRPQRDRDGARLLGPRQTTTTRAARRSPTPATRTPGGTTARPATSSCGASRPRAPR